MTTENKVNFLVHNIYIKDVSFEAPNSPHVFTLDWKPKLDFQFNMDKTPLEANMYEVTLTITVEVKMNDEQQQATEQTAFIVEVKQAGVFLLEGLEDAKQIDFVLSTTAPTILFPYAREVVSSLVTKGSFPQLIIPPMNFEAMYEEHLTQQQNVPEVAHA